MWDIKGGYMIDALILLVIGGLFGYKYLELYPVTRHEKIASYIYLTLFIIFIIIPFIRVVMEFVKESTIK